MNTDAHIDSIQFADGDDRRVIVVGTNLPFRFGKIEEMRLYEDAGLLTVRISRDKLTEEAVAQDPPPSLLTRLLSRFLR